RLPIGIEQCTYINLTSEEGYKNSSFKNIIPPKRRRNCYRIDEHQMNVEITRGRSDIYDILTHLTFLFIESEKIAEKVYIEEKGTTNRDWKQLEEAALKKKLSQSEREVALSHTASIIGRTFEECLAAHKVFAIKEDPERFLKIIYWMGKIALEELIEGHKRSITFSPVLRERLGHHIHGEIWANTIKKELIKNDLIHRPIHLISANMHSVMNTLFASSVLKKEFANQKDTYEIYELLSQTENTHLRSKVKDCALKNGMIEINDRSGTNIDVQIFDTAKIDFEKINFTFDKNKNKEYPVLFVMDYAFGEQAYETIDEFLKPYKEGDQNIFLNMDSISIMGKAGILEGGKGDLMIPNAHIFEGTADNYPFHNELCAEDFKGEGLEVFEGTMISVLGTSLQNKDMLKFFHESTWNVIGLEMEGAHYQKAIQAASRIRKSITTDVK